jgi:hypothetical protein
MGIVSGLIQKTISSAIQSIYASDDSGISALSVPFVNGVRPDWGAGRLAVSTDIYTYNAQKTAFDYLGNVYKLPKHALIPDGVSVFQNLFAVDGVDWTDVSNWTQTNATIAQSSATEMLAEGLVGGTGDFVVIPVLSGVSIAGRTFSAIANLKANDAADIGKDVEIVIRQFVGGGGSELLTSQTVTLTAAYQPVVVGPVTGTAGNTGVRVYIRGAASNSADACLIQYPGIIEWRTGQDTSKPPMPEDIKCFVPVGVETYTVENALEGGADALTGLTTSPAGPVSVSQSAEVPPGFSYAASIETNSTPTSGGRIYDDIQDACSLVDGKDYVISVWARHNGTGGPWSVTTGNISLAGGTELVRLSDTDTTWTQYTTTITYSSAHQYFGAVEDNASQNGGVYLSGLSIRESAPGLYASEYTPNNSVSSGVITRGTGDLLHPWHWERIGYSVPVKRLDVYDPFPTATALSTGSRYVPTANSVTQKIYTNTEAFSNLIKPAARVDFAGEWAKTGAGSITPVGAGSELWSGATTVQAGWTDNGDDTFTCDGTNAVGVIQDSVEGIGNDDFYVISGTVTDHTSGTLQAVIYGEGLRSSFTEVNKASNGDFVGLVKVADTTGVSNRILLWSNNFIGTVGNVSVKKYSAGSYTTLSDEDSTLYRTYWTYTQDVTAGIYDLIIDVSEGTAEITEWFINDPSQTSADLFAINWAEGTVSYRNNFGPTQDWTIQSFELTGESGPVGPVRRLHLRSGNVTAGQFLMRPYGAGFDDPTQGSFNVHGDVVLQRVSAAAEPTWNTLRPRDSVEQLIWPQQDLNTRWTQTNSPDVAQDETDVFGNENMAWTLGDSSAVAFTDVTQTPTTVKGETYCWGMAIKKVASVTAYPAIRVNDGGGGRDLSIDPVNGYAEFVALTADRYGIIDGTIVKALLPHWSNADNYWFVWASAVNGTDTTPSFKIFPAYSASFAGGSSAAAEGEIVIDMPFYHKGDYPYFFNSIATTATVTETVQDWSKIFTFLAEGSGNAVNAVFKHGYYTNEGASIEPEATQDMATAAVLATGGSSSTYPTSWGEADVSGILSVVGEGVSPIYPDARYVDVRCNNTTGSAKNAQVTLYNTSTSGITQGDVITISSVLSLTSGTQAGNLYLRMMERDNGDSFTANTDGSAISLSASLLRFNSSLSVAHASTDRYRPQIAFDTIPDGTDFTIRITLPNSVQEDHVSSVILGQETRTSQVGALKYDIANWSDANCQVRCDFSLGVAQASMTAGTNVWSADASSSTSGLYLQSDGDMAVYDGTSFATITDWGESAGQVVRTAINVSTAADALKLAAYSPNVDTAASAAYDDSLGTPDALTVGATVLSYPMRIHNLASVPNGYEASVTLSSDSERYT